VREIELADANLLLAGRAKFAGWHHPAIDNATHLLYSLTLTSAQFKRWLEKKGCTFESGKGGHLTVRLGVNVTSLPMHGGGKEIGKGLEHHIKKVLGLK
jgi:mRNA interferase HicA